MNITRRHLIAAVPLLATSVHRAAAQAALSGTFKGNGKPASLTQVVAYKGNPESDQPIIELVFTAKNQGNDPKAAFNALFNKYGDALVVKIFPDGKVYSADLVHANLQSPSGSITLLGILSIENFSTANGELSGRLTSAGPRNARDQKFDIDLTFRTKAP